MAALQFIGPVVASVLYVIIFQKAGFRGAMLAVAAAPLLGALVMHLGLKAMIAGGMRGFMLVPLITIPLSLLPLLVLAFKAWPPVGGPQPGGRP